MAFINILLFFLNLKVLLIFQILIKSSLQDDIINIEIIHGTPSRYILKSGEKYLFYINIENYDLYEENMVEILHEDIKILKNLIIYKLTTDISKEEIISHKILPSILFEQHTIPFKYRIIVNNYVNCLFYKKSEIKQKYQLFLIQPFFNKEQEIVFDIFLSNRTENFIIDKKEIENGKIWQKKLKMGNRIETIYKFDFYNISLEKNNLIFFIRDRQVSNFIYQNLSNIQHKDVKMFILEKNYTQKINNTVYVGLLGEIGETTIQIMLNDYDIKYISNENRKENYFYIEHLNCKKDYYIFEHYYSFSPDSIDYTHLEIKSFYGDYEILFYDGYNIIDLNEIFFNNKKEGIKLTNAIRELDNNFNYYKIKCITPSALKFNFYEDDKVVNLTVGTEVSTYITYREFFSDYLFAFISSNYSRYKLCISILGENENYDITVMMIVTYLSSNTEGEIVFLTNEDIACYEFYFNRERISKFNIATSYNIPAYMSFLLTSNLLFDSLTEGLTKINNDSMYLAFKVRKDIKFDFFIFKAYSYNKLNKISCLYDLKIIDPEDISLLIPHIISEKKNEIYLKFSNPYDKYNNNIQENEFMYFSLKFLSSKENFPIYIDIRYYYNNSFINIEKSIPKIIKDQKGYEIKGDINHLSNNKIILNINKCNCSKNYNLTTYYENSNIIINKDFINKKRNIIYHDNIYNNTKIYLYSNDSINNNNTNNTYENIQETETYINNGDLYFNYFSTNESIIKGIEFTDNYNITYQDYRIKINLHWNYYISKNNIIKNLTVKYSLYILPKISPINSICQMSLIPANNSIINKTEFSLNLDPGYYKVGIIASVINEELPMTTFYDFIEIYVPLRINVILIIIFSILVIIVLIIILGFIFYKKKKEISINDINKKFDMNKSNRLISMTRLDSVVESEIEEKLE